MALGEWFQELIILTASYANLNLSNFSFPLLDLAMPKGLLWDPLLVGREKLLVPRARTEAQGSAWMA